MLLSDLVVEKHPHLKAEFVQHYPLADIFTIGYKNQLIGYYDPKNNNLTLDGNLIKTLVED